MSLRINTNISSINAQRSLAGTSTALEKSLERLASGNRINRAGDDAAGLAISENLKAQIRGLGQAGRNAQDGISLIQVAEGGLTEVSRILIRLRELSVQAASDTIGAEERKFLNVEYSALKDEIDRIANSSEFNRVPLLNGSGKKIDIQVGTRNNPTVDRITFDVSRTNVSSAALELDETSVEEKVNSQNSLDTIDSAIVQVSRIRANFGAIQNRLQSTLNNIRVSVENMSAANSRISDADMAEETAELAKNKILMQAGIAVLGQANSHGEGVVQLLGRV